MNIVLMNLSSEFLAGEQQTFFLARGLQESPGHNLVLVCRAGSKLQALARANGIAVFPLSVSFLGLALGRLKLRWFFRRNPGRWILHTHDNISAALGAALAHKQPDVRLLHSRHTPERLPKGKLQDKFRAGLQVACETQEIAFIMAEAQIMPRVLKVIHGGIEVSGYPERTGQAWQTEAVKPGEQAGPAGLEGQVELAGHRWPGEQIAGAAESFSAAAGGWSREAGMRR